MDHQISSAILNTLVNVFSNHWPLFLALFGFWLLAKVLRRPQFKGWIGEASVSRLLRRKLDPKDFRVFDDLYLPRPDGNGTTQIDHVVVSTSGIFVIETKNMKGWIFGTANSRQWTQSNYGKKYRFQNPLHQNALHLNALSAVLGISKDKFHNIVFFVGDATLKTDLPPNVMTKGLVSFIRAENGQQIDRLQFEQCVSVLEDVERRTNRRQVKKAHVARLRSASH